MKFFGKIFGHILGPLAVSSKCADKMLISPTKYGNPNIGIFTAMACFTANQHMFSPELPAEKSMAQVLPLTASTEILLAVKLNLKFHLN